MATITENIFYNVKTAFNFGNDDHGYNIVTAVTKIFNSYVAPKYMFMDIVISCI